MLTNSTGFRHRTTISSYCGAHALPVVGTAPRKSCRNDTCLSLRSVQVEPHFPAANSRWGAWSKPHSLNSLARRLPHLSERACPSAMHRDPINEETMSDRSDCNMLYGSPHCLTMSKQSLRTAANLRQAASRQKFLGASPTTVGHGFCYDRSRPDFNAANLFCKPKSKTWQQHEK